jgi:hypothetical protein
MNRSRTIRTTNRAAKRAALRRAKALQSAAALAKRTAGNAKLKSTEAQ